MSDLEDRPEEEEVPEFDFGEQSAGSDRAEKLDSGESFERSGNTSGPGNSESPDSSERSNGSGKWVSVETPETAQDAEGSESPRRSDTMENAASPVAEPELALGSPQPEPPSAAPAWTHHRALVSGIHLHYVQQGSGPLVLMLHGFPEFWYGWRHQISRIAEAGFQVVAPDMRGYNESDKPRAVAAYRLEILADDVAGLVRYFGVRKAHVIGHDWGGVIAQAFAVRHPQLLDRLIVLNAPHPGTYAREVKRLRQLGRSWYALAFQLPWLPERLIRARDHALIRRVFTHDLPPGTFSDEDIERYIEAMEKPGALTSMLNYYRATIRRGIGQGERWARPVEARTLFIWGERDRYLVPELLNGLTEWMPRLRIERFRDASHWVHHEEPERVGTTIVEFLKSKTG